MTEQSYLPPELGQPSRSEIIACEPNAAQIAFGNPMLFRVGVALLTGGFGLFAGVSFLFPRLVTLSIVSMVLATVGVLLIAGDAFSRSSSRTPAITALRAMYPEIGLQNLAEITVAQPPFAGDGQEHARDIGFLTIERDLVHWRGGWYQMQIRRDDIERIGTDYLSSLVIVMRPGAFGEIRRIGARMRKIGSSKSSHRQKLENLRIWHDGLKID